ncbi:hypothetical protein [Oceanobacillus halophilus]|uniref:hypothetical protein n=1 Tax=Oceanobacillus halophilus TaxID=930130 RepID=UPI0011C45730|nr:hypothetical protein [Oceanobacillus halophilus]
MKKAFSMIGIMVVLIYIAFLESPSDTYHGFTPGFDEEIGDVTEEVNAELGDEINPNTYTSIEYRMEGTKIVDGHKVEAYREYEIYTDNEGNMVKEVPTSNYDYLRYKIEE